MVVAGKIFKLSQPLTVGEIAAKLNGYHVEEDFEEGDYKFKLVNEVTYLTPKPDLLTGIFSSDYVIHVFHRGTSAPFPRTVEAMFSFASNAETTFLAVVERKRTANLIANKLSEILFGKVGIIVNTHITPDTLKAFHDRNPEETKITFFDDVDIPNVDKLSLYGPDLNNTSLFEDYMKHGNLWYVVGRSKDTGYVVGITREASVTVFNLAEKTAYLEYLAKEIYSLLQEKSK
ncbi:MAG: hypothetical protein ACBZ72_06795 [Candidatus Bathyarchaeia archaeon]|jgi:hypothetical protein